MADIAFGRFRHDARLGVRDWADAHWESVLDSYERRGKMPVSLPPMSQNRSGPEQAVAFMRGRQGVPGIEIYVPGLQFGRTSFMKWEGAHMLATHQVKAGKYYIKEQEQSALKVLELAGQVATYSVYELGDGSLSGAPYRLCTTKEIIDWADREATPEEAEQLKSH